jgi:ubiquinone/menaquinone biosynthesis C-methylase UbiE
VKHLVEDDCCSVQKCDIFDFMAKHVGLTVLHPGGFKSTGELFDFCKITNETKVLDIASGKGTTSIKLAKERGTSVIGIDISEDLVNEAKGLATKAGVEDKVKFQTGDAMALPFDDSSFDVAISQAMLVLVPDQKRTISEALRVVKPGGYAGWIELSWKKPPTKEFLDGVSNVICAYCMLNVHTYDGWKKVFKEAGAKDLTVHERDMVFSGMKGMMADEGLSNSMRVMRKYMFDSQVRNRMKTMDNFFSKYPEYFGYGIYIVRK